MTIDQMRALLGLGPEVPDAEVVDLYAAYLAGAPEESSPAYARLSLADFQALYPAFATLTDGPYAAWATKAEAQVGEEYGTYRQDAAELLTAHLLAMSGVGMATGTEVLSATGATSFKSGTFSATISDSVVARRARGGFQATVWGQQFAAIRNRLFGGPRLVGCV